MYVHVEQHRCRPPNGTVVPGCSVLFLCCMYVCVYVEQCVEGSGKEATRSMLHAGLRPTHTVPCPLLGLRARVTFKWAAGLPKRLHPTFILKHGWIEGCLWEAQQGRRLTQSGLSLSLVLRKNNVRIRSSRCSRERAKTANIKKDVEKEKKLSRGNRRTVTQGTNVKPFQSKNLPPLDMGV